MKLDDVIEKIITGEQLSDDEIVKMFIEGHIEAIFRYIEINNNILKQNPNKNHDFYYDYYDNKMRILNGLREYVFKRFNIVDETSLKENKEIEEFWEKL